MPHRETVVRLIKCLRLSIVKAFLLSVFNYFLTKNVLLLLWCNIALHPNCVFRSENANENFHYSYSILMTYRT